MGGFRPKVLLYLLSQTETPADVLSRVYGTDSTISAIAQGGEGPLHVSGLLTGE